jgi:hypothetical protein
LIEEEGNGSCGHEPGSGGLLFKTVNFFQDGSFNNSAIVQAAKVKRPDRTSTKTLLCFGGHEPGKRWAGKMAGGNTRSSEVRVSTNRNSSIKYRQIIFFICKYYETGVKHFAFLKDLRNEF